MKKLIINADDLGLSRSVNKGIIELFCKGVLTSSSLLVNMPGFDDAVSLIKSDRSLCVGVHINVVRGQPVSPVERVGSLCKGDSFRGSIPYLMALPYVYKQGLEEFATECRAQIEKALSKGVCITHLDSDKHIHIIRPFFKTLLKVAQEYGILKIRCINETPYLPSFLFNPSCFFNQQRYTALYLSYCSMENRKLLDAHNFHSPDHFFGVSATGHMTLEDYIRILSDLKEGTTEIMCHPGYVDDEWQNYPLNQDRINIKRQKELSVLLDPRIKESIQQHGISLMNYREL
jgi:predicted glycoside hydrolase/deacetylase ChbG (UPF0249 family)